MDARSIIRFREMSGKRNGRASRVAMQSSDVNCEGMRRNRNESATNDSDIDDPVRGSVGMRVPDQPLLVGFEAVLCAAKPGQTPFVRSRSSEAPSPRRTAPRSSPVCARVAPTEQSDFPCATHCNSGSHRRTPPPEGCSTRG